MAKLANGLAPSIRCGYAVTVVRVALITLGTLFVGIGLVGVVLPGLPTTPFMIMAAGCYVKSSQRLYRWVTDHPLFGTAVKRFLEERTISRRGRVASLGMMWIMIGLSVAFVLTGLTGRIAVLALGIIGTVVVLSVRTDGR
jgi:hypothetical protein